PVAYQEEPNGLRAQVLARYERRKEGGVGFALGSYDHSRALVIDPTLVYSTYLGGSSFDAGAGIAVDPAGSAYVTGYTASSNFTFPMGYQSAHAIDGGGYDAFVMKFSVSGSALAYATYLGGDGNDYGAGIAVDSFGNAYVTGSTSSSNFPTQAP